MAKKPTSINASLPRDDDSAAMQILSPGLNATIHLTATEAADDSSALPANTDVVRIACAAGAIWLAFGPSDVAAAATETDSMLFPVGAETFNLRDTSYTWVAARSVSGAGNVAVTATKME